MPRQIVKSRAVVLRVRRLGDTSKLLTLYTEEHGKLKATAKGARKPKSKFAGLLEPTNLVHAVCYLREERDLQTLSDCDLERAFVGRRRDLRLLALGSAACELVERLTVDLETNKRLYACLEGVLKGLEEVEVEQAESLFWYFQLRAAEALGYRPELRRCSLCGKDLDPKAAWFSAAAGGSLCPACGPVSGLRVAGGSLALLASLQGLRTYSREAMPANPAGRAEIVGLLRSFLEYHGGQGRLKSLDFLESVRRFPVAEIVGPVP
jgi:DNA repair protein RecO (recombination protein O)